MGCESWLMSNLLFASAKEAFLSSQINLLTDTIKMIIVDVDDIADSSAHDNLDDIPSGARIGTAVTLTTPSVTGGSFTTDNVTFTAVTGDVSERVYIYKHTGTESTSKLISRHDVTITPNGSNYVVNCPVGGWFSL